MGSLLALIVDVLAAKLAGALSPKGADDSSPAALLSRLLVYLILAFVFGAACWLTYSMQAAMGQPRP